MRQAFGVRRTERRDGPDVDRAEQAFRAECRGWLEANVPRSRCRPATPARASPGTSSGSGSCFDARWSVVSWPEEYGGRAASALGVADLRGGVLPGRRAAARHPERHLPAGADHLRVRHPGAEGPHPAADGRRRGPVVPGLDRAQRRQRPRRHQEPRRSATTSRRLAAHRAEDVDDARRVLQLALRPVPHRPRRRAPPRPDVLPRAARRRRA